MEKRRFTIPSSDGLTTLHGIHWIPEGEVRAVFQIVHGMVEHIGRYEELAEHMTEAGFAVIGHDHLGHGASVRDPEDLGYFADEKGDACLVKDMHRITCLAKRLHPDVPVFILGHSMGSFLLRRYITRYGKEIQGAVICGTGDFREAEVRTGLALAERLEQLRGRRYRSRLLDAVALGQFAMQYGNRLRPGSWLSRNEASVEAYRKDPRCQFTFTVGAYHDFFHLLKELCEEKDFVEIPRDLPVLFVSGMDDPLGGYTKRVLRVYNRFVEMEMRDVDIYLYPEDRHEVLNELDRDQVHQDILRWMESRLTADGEEDV
ncbi:MAG: alpha/beta hydrolase [Lachnospiraceae bacterium]|nr:alpha/beta hydrolase [Lachnospiraceae bacterium]